MTLRSALLASAGGTVTEVDPYYNLTTLHLKGDVVDQSVSYNAFSDESTNQFPITVNGDARGTPFSPYNKSWSNYFVDNGANASAYLSTTISGALSTALTGASQTREFWWNRTAAGSSNTAVLRVNGGDQGTLYCTGGNLVVYNGSAIITVSLATYVPLNVWTHIALTQGSGVVTLWINGVSRGTSTTVISATGTALQIGGANDMFSCGYISNVRISNSVRYTVPFDPSAAPFVSDANTILLTCQGNRFFDQTGKTITVTGSPTVQSFSPFLETDTVTGSGYFDGNGDYLDAADNAGFAFGTGDGCIELWYYPLAISNYLTLFCNRTSVNSGDLFIHIVSDGSIAYYESGTQITAPAGTLKLNAWIHLAFVRRSGTRYIYVNGVSVASGSVSNVTSQKFRIGASQVPNEYLNAYISDLRVVKGTAVYTGNFTPPTAPLATTQSAGTNIAAIPQFVYTTFDSGASSVTLSNGNLTLTGVGGSGYNKANTTTAVSSGKWYFEATLVSAATDTSIGISQGNSSSTYPGQEATSYAYVLEKGQKFNGNSAAGYAASLAAGDVFMCAFDLDNNKLFFGKNGSWFASSDPVTGANPAFTLSAGTYRAVGRPYSTNTVTFNFGASAFAYTPPTGFVGLRGPATQLLTLQKRGASQNIGIIDTSPYEHVITKFNNVTQGSFSPFQPGGWSNLFSGSSYLSIAGSANLNSTGDFTLEAWAYVTSASAYGGIVSMRQSSGQTAGAAINIMNTGFLDFAVLPGGAYSSTAVPLNQWFHVALVRSGTATNNCSCYLNGNRIGQFTSTAQANGVPNVAVIGRYYADGTNQYFINGYISNVRYVTGAALYSGATAPVPTTPLTNTPASGTCALLACQDNRFRDASSNNFTITPNGSPSVQAFSPFLSSTRYDPVVHGGSGYFDGTGDYLSLPTNSTSLLLGNSDFTVECWVYWTASVTRATILSGQSDGATAAGSSYSFIIGTSGTIDVWIGTTNYSLTQPVPTLNTWAHIAFVRTGGTLSIFLNGSRTATRSDLSTSSVNNGSTTVPFQIGASNAVNLLTGYISSLRLIKGSGGYDATSSTITVPTAPLQPIGNTSLLLNFANAGVIDSTAKNVIETVGNSGVTTSAFKKYGSGALTFDGNADQQRVTPIAQPVLGNGDWTVEFWAYANATPASGYCGRFVYPSAGFFIRNGSGTVIDAGFSGSAVALTSASGVAAANTWQHIALTKSSNTVNLYVNGICRATTSSWTWNEDLTQPFTIGSTYSASEYFNGYIDDFRVTRLARYTGSVIGTTYFTPPTKAFAEQGSGTYLPVTAAAPATIEALVVGGGGGGAYDGGGGGAGGIREFVGGNAIAVSAGTNYLLTIGAGGAGGGTSSNGSQGNSSVFSTITAVGGGFGASAGASSIVTGGNGGSGGGGSRGPSVTAGGKGIYPGSTYVSDTRQGYDGGSGQYAASNYGAGGGGGAGAVGGTGSATTGGAGGIGVQSSITGVSPAPYYSGGGGGNTYQGGTPGAGGLGGGGAGAFNATAGTAGTANTGGGGGGGGGGPGLYGAGGNGGSGVVIIAYPNTFRPIQAISPGLAYTIDSITRPGYRVYRFTSGTGAISW